MPGETQVRQGVREGQEVRGHGFTHLHVAAGYSARYGASLPHVLVQRAVERGMSTLALTDRDTVAGTVRFAKAAAAESRLSTTWPMFCEVAASLANS